VETSTTNFHPPLWPTRVPIRAKTLTQIYPFDSAHLFSPTRFHPFPPTFFHPLKSGEWNELRNTILLLKHHRYRPSITPTTSETSEKKCPRTRIASQTESTWNRTSKIVTAPHKAAKSGILVTHVQIIRYHYSHQLSYNRMFHIYRSSALKMHGIIFSNKLFEKTPPPPGGFPIYYVPWSRTGRKRTPLKEFVPGSSRGVLFLRVLDEGT